ncbi:MAG TPA: VTT domain-containing protein [Terriglobales bacterium]|nr:VTT domain-containing protein [Terriglobales bacterium]
MKTLKRILTRYTKWLWSILAPLGIWGVFVVAAIDGSFLGLPMDAIVAGYVYQDRSKFLLYVILASAGSAVGSSVLYLVGYLGGETVLRRRMSSQRFEKIHRSFDQHKFWALMFPAMLPPPTPFKLFVLAAAVFEMNFGHFLLAIFAGRFVRFLILSLLTIRYGKGVVDLVAHVFRTHLHWTLGILGALILLAVLVRQLRRRNRDSRNN